MPMLRSVRNKTKKVRFEALIDYFGLPIELRMVGYAPFKSGSLELKQLFPKKAKKYVISICNERLGNAIEAHNFF